MQMMQVPSRWMVHRRYGLNQANGARVQHARAPHRELLYYYIEIRETKDVFGFRFFFASILLLLPLLLLVISGPYLAQDVSQCTSPKMRFFSLAAVIYTSFRTILPRLPECPNNRNFTINSFKSSIKINKKKNKIKINHLN